MAHTVLIIEDNQPNMMMAQELLEIAGYQTLQADDADKGIALARQHHPDLILMDMHLPIRNGYEASRILKSDPDTQDITIVAFTAMAMEDEIEKAMNHGCSGVISKPIDVDHFAETIAGFVNPAANVDLDGSQVGAASSMPVPNASEGCLPQPEWPMLKVLVAMDQSGAQQVREHLMPIAQGLDILPVKDGQTVIRRASAEKPDLIMLDVTTPGMDGDALLEQLKADPAISGLPVILISEASQVPEWGRQLKQAGVEYVTKPLCPEEIQAKVQTALNTRLLEARLAQQREDLEQFLSLASHDLQAPLRKISQFSEMLQSAASHELSSPNQELLGVIQRSAQQMQAVLTDLLTFSRLNQKSISVADVSLADMISEILAEQKERITALDAHIELGRMVSLKAHPQQLKQLLTELIDNALKFRQEETPPVIRIASEITGDGVCKITVEDDGLGFNMDHACRIFKPFERLHAVSRYTGTGMGLAIAKKIVERHGGTIQAQPLPGHGAVFTILLPGHSAVPTC